MTVERVLLYIIVILILAVVGAQGAPQNIALTPSVLVIPSGAVSANCPAPQAGSTIYCYAFDKYQISGNGAAYVELWPSPAAAPITITINGTQKTLPAAFTITGTTTNPAVTATATGSSTTIAAN